MTSVPSISQVQPGAHVSIVLKADQRTGREVRGQVQDVLTRGNHPRGIKVRLQDGRIGRVQRMANSDAGAAVSNGMTTTTTTTTTTTVTGEAVSNSELHTDSYGHSRPRQQHPRYRDVRLDEHLERPPEQFDLLAYAKPARRQKGRKQPPVEAPAEDQSQATATASCPVCASFEGDETAVAHHVETHFSSG